MAKIEIADKTGALRMCIDVENAEPEMIGRERNVLWHGDPVYWGKHDPILFPTIGNSWEQRIVVEGKTYPMPKHGFGQRLPWHLASGGYGSSATLELCNSEESGKHYPFPFAVRQRFDITDEKTVKVTWEVESSLNLPFMMGAHPAFELPDFNPDDEVHGYLQFDTADIVSNSVLPDGFLHPEQTTIALEEGNILPLKNDTFACDTLLDIRGLNKKVTLLDKNRKPIVAMTHDMPVLALWSPKHGCCPFVCIEPWCGICDVPGYNGEFAERQHIQHTNGKMWTTAYTIEVL